MQPELGWKEEGTQVQAGGRETGPGDLVTSSRTPDFCIRQPSRQATLRDGPPGETCGNRTVPEGPKPPRPGSPTCPAPRPQSPSNRGPPPSSLRPSTPHRAPARAHGVHSPVPRGGQTRTPRRPGRGLSHPGRAQSCSLGHKATGGAWGTPRGRPCSAAPHQQEETRGVEIAVSTSPWRSTRRSRATRTEGRGLEGGSSQDSPLSRSRGRGRS